jgi:hypothetical protein
MPERKVGQKAVPDRPWIHARPEEMLGTEPSLNSRQVSFTQTGDIVEAAGPLNRVLTAHAKKLQIY